MAVERKTLQARFEKGASCAKELHAVFVLDELGYEVYFRSDDISLMERPEVLVAAGVIPAMCTGREFHLESALAPLFSSGVQKIQSVLDGWYGSFQRVEVVAGVRQATVPNREGKRVGLKVMGVLHRCNVFEKPLRIWRVLGIKTAYSGIANDQFYNLEELKKEPRHRMLYRALRVAFLRSRIREFRKSFSPVYSGLAISK